MLKPILALTLYASVVASLLALPGCRKAAETKHVTPEQAKVQAKVERDRGLPMRLVLPEDAATPEDLDLIQPRYNADMTNWNAPFAYPHGFEKVVASFDEQLKPQGFLRLSGPLHDVEPGFKMGDRMKPVTASGKKAWISKDHTVLVSLEYQFRRGDKGAEEVNNYALGVVRFGKPQEIKAPNKTVPIP